MISMGFFMIHMHCHAYETDNEDQLQFCAMLALTLTLFGGIVLKTDQEDENMYGKALISFMLITINITVMITFVVKSYLSFTTAKKSPHAVLRDKAASVLAVVTLKKFKPHLKEAMIKMGLEPYTEFVLRLINKAP